MPVHHHAEPLRSLCSSDPKSALPPAVPAPTPSSAVSVSSTTRTSVSGLAHLTPALCHPSAPQPLPTRRYAASIDPPNGLHALLTSHIVPASSLRLLLSPRPSSAARSQASERPQQPPSDRDAPPPHLRSAFCRQQHRSASVVEHLEGKELRVLALSCRVGQWLGLHVARPEANSRDSPPVVTAVAHDAVEF